MSNKDKFVVQMYVLSVLWMILATKDGAEALAVMAMGAWLIAALISQSN